MPAKIKTPASHHSNSPRPRGTARHSFEKVYWPFIPVALAFAILLPIGFQAKTLSRFAHHPFSKVLAYSTSRSPGSMLAETNLDRQINGEPPLKLSSELSRAAMTKASDMAKRNYWSHNTPEGTPPWSFVSATDYQYQKIGENLATGFYNEEEAVRGWMASPSHRENMLDPAYSEVGFGFSDASHYSAVGGGPATIFVAYYGKPAAATITLASKILNTSNAPSTANPLASHPSIATTPVQTAFSRSSYSSWAPVGLAVTLLGIFSGLIIKHLRLIRRSLRTSQNYVWHHPLFDMSLLILAALVVTLWQSIGLVK